MQQSSIRGFTLFELLVVVSIIGIVYSLFNQKLQISAKNEHVTLTNFTFYASKKKFSKTAKLLCLYDELKEGCRFYLDGKLQSRRFVFFDSFDYVQVYKEEANSRLEKKLLLEIKEDDKIKEVVFSLVMYPNGGFDSVVLRDNDDYYLFNSHTKTMIFHDLSSVENFLQEDKKNLYEDI